MHKSLSQEQKTNSNEKFQTKNWSERVNTHQTLRGDSFKVTFRKKTEVKSCSRPALFYTRLRHQVRDVLLQIVDPIPHIIEYEQQLRWWNFEREIESGITLYLLTNLVHQMQMSWPLKLHDVPTKSWTRIGCDIFHSQGGPFGNRRWKETTLDCVTFSRNCLTTDHVSQRIFLVIMPSDIVWNLSCICCKRFCTWKDNDLF